MLNLPPLEHQRQIEILKSCSSRKIHKLYMISIGIDWIFSMQQSDLKIPNNHRDIGQKLR